MKPSPACPAAPFRPAGSSPAETSVRAQSTEPSAWTSRSRNPPPRCRRSDTEDVTSSPGSSVRRREGREHDGRRTTEERHGRREPRERRGKRRDDDAVPEHAQRPEPKCRRHHADDHRRPRPQRSVAKQQSGGGEQCEERGRSDLDPLSTPADRVAGGEGRSRSKRSGGRHTGDPGRELRPAPRRRMREHRKRSEEHTSELQSRVDLVCRLLLEKKKKKIKHLSNEKKKKHKKKKKKKKYNN